MRDLLGRDRRQVQLGLALRGDTHSGIENTHWSDNRMKRRATPQEAEGALHLDREFGQRRRRRRAADGPIPGTELALGRGHDVRNHRLLGREQHGQSFDFGRRSKANTKCLRIGAGRQEGGAGLVLGNQEEVFGAGGALVEVNDERVGALVRADTVTVDVLHRDLMDAAVTTTPVSNSPGRTPVVTASMLRCGAVPARLQGPA